MARRNTVQSMVNGGPPEIMLSADGLPDAPLVSRIDFEQAQEDMTDDDEQQRASGATIVRCGTGRRSQAPPTRSRDSSPSSRSTSPANSVDAFADPRARGRANTIGSKCPSDLDLGIHRTISGGTHCCRPTFSSGSICQGEIDIEPLQDAEDDAGFPQPSFAQIDESYQTFKIDFEELDELVAESTRGDPQPARNRRQKLSFSSQGNRPNLDRPAGFPAIPENAVAQPAGSYDLELDSAIDSESILDEKNDDPLCEKGPPRERIPVEPHRYSFFSSEIEQTIHAADFADLLSSGQTSRDLFELPPDSGVWWMNVVNPSEKELNVFKGAFGIHRLTTEDIITQEAREKVELFNQYYFVCFRSFYHGDKNSEKYMEPVNVYMVVFRQGILTFTYSQSPHAANVRKRIGKLRDYMLLGADWICYAIIDDIVDAFIPVIDTIQIETDQIEDQVFTIRADDFTSLLQLIGDCRKKVMSLMRLLGGKADVIKGFAKRCTQQYSVAPRPEIGLYLGDIQDHVVTNMNNLGHFEKMLSRSHSNCLAQISVDAIAQGNRANEVLSKITLLASILVPLNLICGLFGMNVPVPGKESGGLYWFFGIFGFICIIVVVCLYTARRLRFI